MPSTAAIMGHPIHAILVNFPVALFSCLLLMDLLYLKTRTILWAHCGNIFLILGEASTLAAAIPGIIDYLTMQMPPLATRHLIAGLSLAVLYGVQIVLRKPARFAPDSQRLYLPFSIVGMLLLSYQGFLGGELVYRYHVGVIPVQSVSSEPSSSPLPNGAGGGTPGGGQHSTPGSTSADSHPAPVLPASELQLAKTTYDAKCGGCHKMNGKGGDVGPDLSHEGAARTADWLSLQIRNPGAHKSASAMPPFSDLPRAQVTALVDYMLAAR